MNAPKMVVLVVMIAAVIGSIVYLNSQKAERGGGDGGVTVAPRLSADSEESQTVSPAASPEEKTAVSEASSSDKKLVIIVSKSDKYKLANEITTPDGFINTPSTSSGQAAPVTIGEFIGKKVVLLDIWTYSCINCQRTTPYLNAWYEKYASQGLVIIGLHTPEFEFEKNYQNVLAATKRLGIKYPVVLDNDYSTWNAYQNRFWPRKYLIDIDGYVVYDHIGEGAYDETEQKIQETLAERMSVLGIKGEIAQEIARPTAVQSTDPSQPRSGEVYFGAARNESIANGVRGAEGEQVFMAPAAAEPNLLYLSGTWNIQSEFAENKSAGAKIIFRYRAKNVYFVGSADMPVDARITRDGKPLGGAAGEDVEKNTGILRVQEDRLYKIIEDPAGYGEHTIEIIIEDPGLRAFTFTFG